ncbi:MAG: translocation/assembly module TamB domain-containing protein, partial [Acidobacteriota bacterium]
FSGEKMSFAGQSLSNVRGRIKGDEDSVEFPELDFNLFEGDVTGSLKINTSMESIDVDLKGEEIDLSSISESLRGFFSVDLKGKVEFGEDLILGTYNIQNLQFSSIKETGTQGEIKINYDENHIRMQIDGNFNPGENEFLWEMNIPLKGKEVSGKVEGFFNNLDLLLPWKGAQGNINYLLNLRIPSGKTEVKGVVDFQGSQLPFPNFPHALEDFSGLVFVDNSHLSIRSIKGRIGGGSVEASGDIHLGKSGIEHLDVTANGNEMMLSILERTQAMTGGEMNLKKDEAGFVFSADFFIEKLLWRRELDEEISFSSEVYPSYSQEPGFFDELNLDIRLRAEKNAWIENSLGSIQAGFNLNIKGNVFSPVLQGEIEAIEGTVYFQDREFNLLQGRVNFFNPAMIDPYINFKGETYVKNYHVTFSLEGPLSNLKPEFSSSPPLPPEDVLALLALGQAFRRTYHYDRSIGQSTASLLSFQLSEEAKKRAEELFSIDRFRIDPFIMGSSAEMTARLTLGKKLSRNFFILYSTNLAAQREDITRIEWELSNDFSIVGTRDEMGRISFDVKIHRRF